MQQIRGLPVRGARAAGIALIEAEAGLGCPLEVEPDIAHHHADRHLLGVPIGDVLGGVDDAVRHLEPLLLDGEHRRLPMLRVAEQRVGDVGVEVCERIANLLGGDDARDGVLADRLERLANLEERRLAEEEQETDQSPDDDAVRPESLRRRPARREPDRRLRRGARGHRPDRGGDRAHDTAVTRMRVQRPRVTSSPPGAGRASA